MQPSVLLIFWALMGYSNNLRAKPGAFVCEPLKAAFGGANATPAICYRLKAVNQRHRFSCSSR